MLRFLPADIPAFFRRLRVAGSLGWLAGGGLVMAQVPTLPPSDSGRVLTEVRVVGYATNRPLAETGASVGLLGQRDLQQRGAGLPSLVSALNTLAGVRMDERSPGSYRLSIRGSLLRSPFGVRNVKVYWQELPLTDAGGNSPLNALDVRSIGRVEVIRGPGGSLYGAGTGGTVLLGGPVVSAGQTQAEASAIVGSYGLLANGLTVTTASRQAVIRLAYNHVQATGYRQHSALVRDNLHLTVSVRPDAHQTLTGLGLYTDLAYQTPGGLTEAQFRADPSGARPATRTLPGSVAQRAGIYQRYGYGGLIHEIQTTDKRWQHRTAIYGSFVELRNPFITNYERRADQGIGGRTTTQIQVRTGRWPTTVTLGAELQSGFTVDRNYGNRAGQPDTLQTDDELRARLASVFGQVEQGLPLGLLATLGLSRNDVRYAFARFSVRLVGNIQRDFLPVWLPRLSVLKRIGLSTDPARSGESMTVFLSSSAGYSAPTSAEVLSSAGPFNAGLEPERGQSLEMGLWGVLFREKLRFELAGYRFRLLNTIVRRSTETGADYFVNAGQTDQPGLEMQVQYQPFLRPVNAAGAGSVLRFFQLWHSLSLTRYRFGQYVQATTDLSGNRVPGVAPVSAVFGLDAEGRGGWYAHMTFSFLNPFPLNETNTATALPTRLLTATAGYRRPLIRRWLVDAFVTGDNLLDQSYSAGYDLNALGGRYYNAAPRRGVSVGLRIVATYAR